MWLFVGGISFLTAENKSSFVSRMVWFNDPLVRGINSSSLFWFSDRFGYVSLSHQFYILAPSTLPVCRKPRNSYSFINPSYTWFEISPGGGAKKTKNHAEMRGSFHFVQFQSPQVDQKSVPIVNANVTRVTAVAIVIRCSNSNCIAV